MTQPDVTMNNQVRSRDICRVLVAAITVVSAGCNEQRATSTLIARTSVDSRTPVELPADGQQAVLQEMRTMLGAVGGSISAAARGATVALFAAVAPAGSAAAADAALEALLPLAWKELAERTHGGFDSLVVVARLARSKQAIADTVLTRLAQLVGSCTACHETFRVTVR